MESTTDRFFVDWMVSPTMMREGHIRYFRRDAMSKLFDVEFWDAYCVFYREEFDDKSSIPLTTCILISPRHHPLRRLADREVVESNRLGAAGGGKGHHGIEPEISVSAEFEKDTFMPLGVPDYDENSGNDKIKFTINIAQNPADRMQVEVRDGSQTFYKEEITDRSMLSVGNHRWTWDGFDNDENLDTAFLREAQLNLKVTVWRDGTQEMAVVDLAPEPTEVAWVE